MTLAMRSLLLSVVFALLPAGNAWARSQGTAAAAPAAEISTLLRRQASDWNRGDLDAFAMHPRADP